MVSLERGEEEGTERKRRRSRERNGEGNIKDWVPNFFFHIHSVT